MRQSLSWWLTPARGPHLLRLAGSPSGRRVVRYWLQLGVARVAVLLLPDRVVIRRFGSNIGPLTAWAPEPTEDAEEEARAVGQLILRAARRTPWRAECYPQALLASHVLRQAGIAHLVLLGVRRAETLEAHAWVEAGHVGVVGTELADKFVVVGRFPWPAISDAAA